MYQILIVEDDRGLNQGIALALRQEGVSFLQAYNAAEGRDFWEKGHVDMALLDVNLPDGNGYELLEKIRKTSQIPVLLITANDLESDEITGFSLGADDYITKPFKLAVFLSRVNALLRRSENFNQSDTELKSNGIQIQLLKQEVTKDGVPLDLTASEYKLLCLFMENPNIVLSPEQILSNLWDCNEKYIDSNTLTVYIRRLRTKIEDIPADPQKIVTVRRMGYKWNVAD